MTPSALPRPPADGPALASGRERRTPLLRLSRYWTSPDDDPETRLQKTLLVTLALLMSIAGLIWGTFCYLFGEPLAALVPFSYAGLTLLNAVVFRISRQYTWFRSTQLLLSLSLPFMLHVALGGFALSSAVVLWSILAPLGALVFSDRREAVGWFLAYVLLVAVGIGLEGRLRPENNLSAFAITLFFFMNISGPSVVIFVLLHYFVGQKNQAVALLREQHGELEQAYHDIKAAQSQLIQAEKLASLGQLTAGIAHEIKNPLNFITNFAALSGELCAELREDLERHKDRPVAEVQAELADLLSDLQENTRRIDEHGRRADSIVRNMMQHAAGHDNERLPVDVNTLLDEYIDLAYHGMRAQRPDFQVRIERTYDASAAETEGVPAELGRVFLNLLNNAFFAVHEHTQYRSDDYVPTVRVRTEQGSHGLEVRIADNGPGIPDAIRDRIFEPFFTTKPTGSGTGLGLSLAYEIVTLGHGGSISVDSPPGEGATFVVWLPNRPGRRRPESVSTGLTSSPRR